jgi:hypothetical protein
MAYQLNFKTMELGQNLGSKTFATIQETFEFLLTGGFRFASQADDGALFIDQTQDLTAKILAYKFTKRVS